MIDEYLAALETKQWGAFPFGRPNSQRPPTLPSDTSGPVIAVLGVYPSALHLSWRAPDGQASIGALAVDVEPSVFWPGDLGVEREQRIAEWKQATNDDGSRGTFGWAGLNGSSGSGFAKNYLEPMGATYAQCFLTDCVPFYFVKSGDKEQGTAISEKWTPFAVEHDWKGGDLPSRPSTAKLVELATRSERSLLEELASAKPTAIVTLGQEAADALRTVAATPVGVQLRADDPTYGIPHRVTLGDREVKWLPLAHPGATRRKDSAWYNRHEAWKATAPTVIDA